MTGRNNLESGFNKRISILFLKMYYLKSEKKKQKEKYGKKRRDF